MYWKHLTRGRQYFVTHYSGFNIMVSRRINIITGLIGLAILATFTVGLSISISSGFAGFEGGLPFAIIVAFVLLLALYDFYDSCIRKRNNSEENSSPENQGHVTPENDR